MFQKRYSFGSPQDESNQLFFLLLGNFVVGGFFGANEPTSTNQLENSSHPTSINPNEWPPSHSTSHPSHPTSNPSHPTSNPSHPTSNPSHPTSNPSHPTSNPSHPTYDPQPSTNKIPAESKWSCFPEATLRRSVHRCGLFLHLDMTTSSYSSSHKLQWKYGAAIGKWNKRTCGCFQK